MCFSTIMFVTKESTDTGRHTYNTRILCIQSDTRTYTHTHIHDINWGARNSCLSALQLISRYGFVGSWPPFIISLLYDVPPLPVVSKLVVTLLPINTHAHAHTHTHTIHPLTSESTQQYTLPWWRRPVSFHSAPGILSTSWSYRFCMMARWVWARSIVLPVTSLCLV